MRLLVMFKQVLGDLDVYVQGCRKNISQFFKITRKSLDSENFFAEIPIEKVLHYNEKMIWDMKLSSIANTCINKSAASIYVLKWQRVILKFVHKRSSKSNWTTKKEWYGINCSLCYGYSKSNSFGDLSTKNWLKKRQTEQNVIGCNSIVISIAIPELILSTRKLETNWK